jgi:protein kinase C substrate 80K-H
MSQQVNFSGIMSNHSILSSCELFSADSSKANQLFADAERELESLISDKEKIDSDALEIFNIHGFGVEGEWKKLDGTCLEKDTGECV